MAELKYIRSPEVITLGRIITPSVNITRNYEEIRDMTLRRFASLSLTTYI